MKKINKKYKSIWEKYMKDADYRTDQEYENEMLNKPSNTKTDGSTNIQASNGSWIAARPLNYDPEMCEYSAVTDMLKTATVDADYKCWYSGNALKDIRNEEEINIFDVIWPFTTDWNIPKWLMVVTDIRESEIDVAWINHNIDDIVKKTIIFDKDKFKKFKL